MVTNEIWLGGQHFGHKKQNADCQQFIDGELSSDNKKKGKCWDFFIKHLYSKII